MSGNSGTKVDPKDPQVRKLVYNMYRGILGDYNNKANDIVSNLPKEMVTEDQGISKQLESMIDLITGSVPQLHMYGTTSSYGKFHVKNELPGRPQTQRFGGLPAVSSSDNTVRFYERK
ncbi:unnamed protein product [Bemisia tabaci]|uniref:Uncharacterized protein n=1 Tax=Bemisia tabaci TaxID=7038 RepID=A0A9P0ACH3_BEMTA|nr:unnamed protein product [Bemisia tabaci]